MLVAAVAAEEHPPRLAVRRALELQTAPRSHGDVTMSCRRCDTHTAVGRHLSQSTRHGQGFGPRLAHVAARNLKHVGRKAREGRRVCARVLLKPRGTPAVSLSLPLVLSLSLSPFKKNKF